MKLSELALLELEFLYRVDWRIIPDNATLVAYYHGLITRTAGYSLEPSSRPASIKSNETSSTQVSDSSLVFPAKGSGSSEILAAEKEENIPVSGTVDPKSSTDSLKALKAEVAADPAAPAVSC